MKLVPPALLAVLLTAPFAAPPACAQPPAGPGFDLQAEANGIKLRLTEARWIAAEDYAPNYSIDGDKRARVLLTRYEWSADEKTGFEEKVALIVDGRRLHSRSGSWGGGHSSFLWPDVGPNLKEAQLEVTLRKRATLEDGGQFPLWLDFGTVAYPAAGASTEVNQNVTTAHGVKVTLLSVSRVAGIGRPEGQVVLKLRTVMPENPPDLTATFNLRSGSVQDDKGTDFMGHSSQGLDARDGLLTGWVADKAAPGATTLQIKIVGTETIPSLALPQPAKVVTLKFDPSTLRRPPLDVIPVVPPAARASAGNLDVTLAKIDNQGWATLFLRDKSLDDSRRSWELAAWAKDGVPIPLTHTYVIPVFWKADGESVAPGETGWRFHPPASGPQVLPATLSFRPVRVRPYALSFKDVPFPDRAGDSLAVNREIALDDGASAVLSRVFRFDAVHPLQTGVGSFDQSKAQGLAFLVEYRTPDETSAASFYLNEARDNTGHEVMAASPDGQMRFGTVGGDATSGASENPKFKQSWLRALPGNGARTVSFGADLTVRTPAGPPVDVTLEQGK